MKARNLVKLSISFIFLCLSSINLSAHNVVGGVYVSGTDIEGEAGYSNGAMANAGTLVKVFDQNGTPLGEVVTDAEGFFVFTAQKRITHVFEINMGAGHTLKMQLPAEELPENLGSATGKTKTTQATISTDATKQGESEITSLMLEKAIAKQIKPLRKEIQALKEKSGFRDMIGGIGYIFGLLGLVVFVREYLSKANK